ncbi:gliding motility-associated C-terminal domain-containing protein [Ferruginibacter lapsinanis]|uniref:Ig-like domain-containing protein n=1 Tax=Ferruginibacter lapsinanis TaxID=563172 RepID=UPI001E3953F1|nr:gliding motility-associated C-terminal domain-containing protein [Ferruginibacter lapsinanis]UEG49097.1 gliding motility-associated C-terminal domain-containing protein [Ferruginibacter lapsinanis]
MKNTSPLFLYKSLFQLSMKYRHYFLVLTCITLVSLSSKLDAQTPCSARLIANTGFTYTGGGVEPPRWDMSQTNAGGFIIDQTSYAYLPSGNFSNQNVDWQNANNNLNNTRQYAIVKNPKDLSPQYADIPTDGMIVINPKQGQNDQYGQFSIANLQPLQTYYVEIKFHNVIALNPRGPGNNCYSWCNWNSELNILWEGNGNNAHDGQNAMTWTGTNGSNSASGNWDGWSNQVSNWMWVTPAGATAVMKGQMTLGSATTGFTFTFLKKDGSNTNPIVLGIDYIKIYGCQQEAINVSGGTNSVCEGTDITLTAQGLGSAGSSYTWYKDGNVLPGRNSDTLNIVSAIGIGTNVVYKAVGEWSNQSVTLTSKLCCSSVGGTSDEVIRQSFDGLAYTCPTGGTPDGSRHGGYADIPGKNVTNFIDGTYSYAGTGCNSLNDGQYAVVQSSYAGNFWQNRPEVKDHTGVAGSGSLFINAIGGVGQAFYKFNLTGLCNGTRYEFSAWYASLATGAETKPNIEFDVMNGSTVVASTTTGTIPENSKWYQATVTFVTPTTGTPTYTLQLVNLITGSSGNDLMIDDIVVKKCTPFINLYQDGTKNSELDVCNDNPVSLKINTYYDLPLAITGSSSGTVYYQWMKSTSPTGPWTLLGTPETTGTYSATPTTTTTYYRAKVSSDYTRASNGNAPLAAECGNDGITTSFKLTKGGNFTIPAATGTTAYCPGNTMTLNGNSGTGDQWEWRKGTSFAAATVLTGYAYSTDVAKKVFSKTFASGDEGNYYFVVKEASGCETYSMLTVTLNPSVTITPATKAADVCLKNSSQTSTLTYTATGTPTNYTITWDAAALSAGFVNVSSTTLTASPLSINVPANAAAATYTGTIAVTKTGNCPSTGTTFTLTVNSLPTPTFTAAPAADICAGGSATYTTQAGQSNYVWSIPGTSGTDYTITSGGVGATSNTVTITWKTAGSKTVTVNYSSNGCPGATAASNTFTVNALPTPTFTTAPSSSVCVGGSATYTTQSGQSNYVWSIPGTAGTDYDITNGGTGSTSNTVTVTWKTAGSKTVTVNYSSNSCAGATAATNTVTVNALPTPTFINPPTDICVNNSVIYTTQSGQSNYVWTVPGISGTDYTITSGGVGTTSNTVTITWKTAGSKTVTVNYSSNSCAGATAATSTITINDIGAPNISCGTSTNNSVAFNWVAMSGATSYTISHTINGGAAINDPSTTGTTFNVASLNPGDEVNITVTPTGNASTCFKSASFKCTATSCPALPAHPPTPDITECNNATVNYSYTASAGGTITWTNSNTAIGLSASGAGTGNTLNLSFTGTNSGSTPVTAKIRTITTYGQCSYPDSFNITITPGAVVTLTSAAATNAQTVCNNKAISDITYSITGTGNNASVSGLPTGVTGTFNAGVISISGTPTQNGVFNYTVTATGTCSNGTATGSITVTALPVISGITPTNPTSCGGNNGSFTITGLTPATSYTVNFIADGIPQAAQVLTSNGAGNIVVGSLKQGSYTGITVTIAGGCVSNQATTSLSDPSVFSPIASSNQPCVGFALNLSSTTSSDPTATYTWTGPNGYTASGATPTITNTTIGMSGVYSVKATVAGCSSSSSVTVTINSAPNAPTGSGAPICGSGSVTLNATLSGNPSDILKWYSDATLTTQVATGTSFSTPSLTSTTDYFVTETNSASCVSASTKVTATISSIPNAPTGKDADRCSAGVVTIGATPSNGANTIKWYSNAGLTTQVGTGSSFTTPSISNTTSYYATETNTAGCTSTTATKVTASINQVPPAPITSDVKYCLNDIATPLTATGTNLAWYDFAGNSNSTAPTPTTNKGGTATYFVTSSNGTCESEKVQIKVFVNNVSAYAGGPILRVDQGIPTQINGKATGDNITISWSSNLYLNSTSIANPIITALTDNIYTMTVRSTDGCVATDDLQVKVLKSVGIPNAFSPNKDGINDTWIIENLEDYPAASVSIFNRYGQMIFESLSGGYTSTPWDGMYKGNPVPVGTYYYIIKLQQNKPAISGSISVIR